MTQVWPSVVHTASLKDKIQNAKVLAVGAGGIGCELLKTLVLTGFQDIEVIDMDTIDTSNLNRQFLFRKWHVGQSKAAVAANAVQQLRPSCKIAVHCVSSSNPANIKEQQYGVDFFRKFSIVLNGLDNLEARRHVNRLCLAAGVPLVESGTAGYLGQVSVHMRLKDDSDKINFQSECFECQPKPVPKTYPVCTIRNTPEKPIHCIVWAKDLLFHRLFGSPDTVSDLDEKSAEEKEAEADGSKPPEDPSDFLRKEGESPRDFAIRIWQRVFCKDIENVLSMEELWKARKKPTALQLSGILGEDTQIGNGNSGLDDKHKVWNVKENTQAFLSSIQKFFEERPGEVGNAVFDKDDDLAVELVTSASNLRAICYDIPTQSVFDAKGMAGNIIHAIATTNATISGMIVVEALKIIAKMPEKCKMSYLVQIPSGKRLITAMALSEPNPNCMVCGTSQLQLSINTQTTNLGTFVDKVLKKQLAMNEPTIMSGNLSYEEGADLDEDEVEANQKLLSINLAQLPGGGISNGSIIMISDQAQDFSCQIVVTHKEEWDEEKEPDGFILSGKVESKASEKPKEDVNGNSNGKHDASDDDLEIVTEPSEASKKRKRPSESVEDLPQKIKQIRTTEDDDDLVMLD